MCEILGIGFILFGVLLILTRSWSVALHERWNSQFRWTRWATGPKVMQASRIANVAVGIVVLGIGLVFLLVDFRN